MAWQAAITQIIGGALAYAGVTSGMDLIWGQRQKARIAIDLTKLQYAKQAEIEKATAQAMREFYEAHEAKQKALMEKLMGFEREKMGQAAALTREEMALRERLGAESTASTERLGMAGIKSERAAAAEAARASIASTALAGLSNVGSSGIMAPNMGAEAMRAYGETVGATPLPKTYYNFGGGR